MLHIVDIHASAPEVENPYAFPLDPFQKWAFQAINNQENVLVTAKTGSGKTLVGEYQIKVSLAKGKRVFYTTPIKSLSNQKFHDLKELGYNVGIMTGDIKFCPQADVVVMTTEILCNLLFKKDTKSENIVPLSLDNVDAIVFDEVHYINNPERGKVWEQCFMLLDRSINLVLLSATIDDAPKFAKWLGDIKQKPIHLISTEYRVVPLIHKVGNETIMDSKDVFYLDAYKRWLFSNEKLKKHADIHKQEVSNRRQGGYEANVVKNKDKAYSFLHRMNELIRSLDEKTLLPALFFVFSRKNCEVYAKKVESTLITSSDTASVKQIMNFHLHKYKYLETSPQYHTLKTLLEKGVAFHHSGLLPILKEIVELLFSKGLIKVLFATETFAVGINMPTKTVIFTSYRKYEGSMRMLRPDEYNQMAGRAGRRGKDTEGLVLYLPDREPESAHDVRTMMTKSNQKVKSRMDFGYDFLIRTFYGNKLEWKELMKESYWFQEHRQSVEDFKKEISEIVNERDSLGLKCSNVSALSHRNEIENIIKTTVNAEKRDYQKKLDEWMQEHSDPVWNEQYEKYLLWDTLNRKLVILEKDLKLFTDYEKIVYPKLEFLKECKFLDEPLGLLASNIHEGHPLITSTIFHKKMFHKLDKNTLIGCIAIFIAKDERGDESLTLDQCEYITKQGNVKHS